MKLNKLIDMPKKGIIDESADLSNPKRNSMARTIALIVGVVITIGFLITCISVFFTHDTQSVLFALIAIILQRCIQGSIEFSHGMKATALNTFLWAIGVTIFCLVMFPMPVPVH